MRLWLSRQASQAGRPSPGVGRDGGGVPAGVVDAMSNLGRDLPGVAEIPDQSVGSPGNGVPEPVRDPDRFDEEHFARLRRESFARLLALPAWGHPEPRESGGPSPDDIFLQSL
jgi:hypothetical protein